MTNQGGKGTRRKAQNRILRGLPSLRWHWDEILTQGLSIVYSSALKKLSVLAETRLARKSSHFYTLKDLDGQFIRSSR